MSNLEDAKKEIATLFEIMSIQKVVCVDDFYEVTAKTVMQLAIPLIENSPILANIPEFKHLNFDDEKTYLFEDIERELSNVSQSRLQEIHQYLYEQQPETSNYHRNSPQVIMQLFQEHNVTLLSPDEWYTQKEDLIQEGSNGSILFLFDRQFNGSREDEGMQIIRDIILKTEVEIICGLLSSHFEPKEEYEKWEEYARIYEIGKDDFLLISKLHRSFTDSAQMIKLIVLNKLCSHLKQGVTNSVKDAIESTAQLIDEIDIYDFEHMVFKTSVSEGVWEPDTLLRIFNIHQRRKVMELIHDNSEVENMAFRIRKASNVNIPNKADPSEQAFKTMQFELYEESQYLNAHHLPLELGDIFETTHSATSRKYILLTQPCDLMVRENGKRSRDMSEGTVARIFSIKEKDLPETSSLYFKLPYYDLHDIYYVNFAETSIVNLWVLDTCVYYSDGGGKFFLNQDVPGGLIPSWSKHYTKAQAYYKKCLGHYHKYKNKLPANILKTVFVPASSKDNVFKAVLHLEDNSIDYQFKRIRRLSKGYASELLSHYGNYLTRSGFDHELDRGLEVREISTE